MKMFSPSLLSSLIAFAGLFSASFYGQTPSSQWAAVSTRKDLFVQEGSVARAAPQSILLIGENHASVKAQSQLAELLEILYKNQSVDAVLVEGSNGEIKASQLRNLLAKPDDANTRAFWKGQLDLGQIAGYEYLALTRPGVRIQGVENMDAKRQYLAGEARRSTLKMLQDQVDLHTRALDLARRALAGANFSSSATDAVLSAYQARITELRSQVRRSAMDYAAARESYTDGIERITSLYTKAQPVLPVYNELVKQAQPYQKLVEQAKKIQAGGSIPPSFDPDKFLTDLRVARTRLEKASTALDEACRKAGYADADAFQSDLTQIDNGEKAVKAAEGQLTKLATPFTKLESDLDNQFLLAANAARTAIGKPVPALQRFLLDEREKSRKANDPEKQYLSDRDKFMVENTIAYLKNANPPVRNVVLIIGYAHLDGMKNRLSQQNISLVAGKIAASEEDIEEWENKAWDRRMRPAMPIFSSAATKELSRLLDQTYEKEMPALLAKLDAIQTNPSAGIALGRTKIFEASTGTAGRKAIVTIGADNLKSDWGAHVVQLGTLPDGSGSGYLIVDRDLARDEVKAHTKGDTAYATLYRTKTARGLLTNVDTAAGTVSLADFKARAPRVGQKTAKRIVIAPEGDEDVLNTALASGGNGSGKPPWTSRRTLFAEPPDSSRPSVFFTKNIRAASERLAAMEKQDPLKIGDIAIIRTGLGDANNGTGLNDLWFTPETGEHARAYFIIGDNTPEFRQRLKEAGQAGLLRNKQIALGTCFDERETNALNDMLLEYGALMVWEPSKRVSPEAATKLVGYMQEVDAGSERVRGMDEYIDRTLQIWHKETGGDSDLEQFIDSVNRALLDLGRKIREALG